MVWCLVTVAPKALVVHRTLAMAPGVGICSYVTVIPESLPEVFSFHMVEQGSRMGVPQFQMSSLQEGAPLLGG